MVARLLEGFETWSAAAQVLGKWDLMAGTPATSAGRGGGKGIAFGGSTMRKNFGSQPGYVCGAAVNVGSSASLFAMQFLDAGTIQMQVASDSLGRLVISRGATAISTSVTAPLATFGTFHYVEFKSIIHNTAGSYDVRVDGVSVLSGSATNTRNTANNSADTVALTGGGLIFFDDVYILDTTGAVNNDFWGDISVKAIYPNADGNYSQWTSHSAAHNWDNVDENPPNTTDYNFTSTVGNKDSYNFSDLTTGIVNAVQLNIYNSKDDAGAHTIAALCRSGGSDAVGPNQSVLDTWTTITQVWDTNPVSSAPWTVSTVNAAEFGQELTG